MALPKLLQKLFDDEGKGPKLKPSIIPTKINGQEPDETGEFNLQLSDPDAATRPEILTAVKKVTEASEVTFEPEESLPSVGHNIGEEWVSYTGVIPFGGIPYCGQEVTRETYRALWEYVQTQGLVKSESEWQSWSSSHGGNVPYYSSGNGSTTFRMPKIVGYVRGASSQSESGEYIAEGLPNHDHIQGGVHPSGYSARYGFVDTGKNGTVYDTGAAVTGTLGMLTSTARGSSIYGNSSHVTPETSVVLFGVYAFGEITNTGSLDAETLATGLATVESNLEAKLEKTIVHIVETWSSGANWYRKYSDGWIEQGGIATTINAYQKPVTFPKAFTTTNYAMVASCESSGGGDIFGVVINGRSKTGATIYIGGNHGYLNKGRWYACGF